MKWIINGKKFNPDTSEELHSSGQGDAACRRDGALGIYRSPKGTVWAVLLYWPCACGDQKIELAEGEQEVARLCQSLQRVKAIESFTAVEEG